MGTVSHVLKRLLIKVRRRARVTRTLFETQPGGLLARAGLLAYVWLPGVEHLAAPAVRTRKFGREALFYPKDHFDLEVWRDIFEDEDYADDLAIDPAVIFDLGAHVGASAIYFALKHPAATIHCFEADPDNYRQLAKNVAQFDRVHAHPFALCGTDRPVSLYKQARSVSHSMVERSPDGRSVTVAGKSLDTLLDALGVDRVDLIKFNIEGMELEVFENFSRRQDVQAYNGHLHLDLIHGSKDDFLALFEGYDVEIIPTKPQRFKFYAHKRPA